jgi:hypothetical protein
MKLLIAKLPPFSSSVQIFFSEPCSQTPSVCALRHQVSHPCKPTGRIMVLYILTFTFLDGRLEAEVPVACNMKWNKILYNLR